MGSGTVFHEGSPREVFRHLLPKPSSLPPHFHAISALPWPPASQQARLQRSAEQLFCWRWSGRRLGTSESIEGVSISSLTAEARYMGQTGFCDILQFPAFFSARIWSLQRKAAPPSCCNLQDRRESANIYKKMKRKAPFVPC